MNKSRIKPVKSGRSMRMSFSRQREVLDMPNLIEVQKNSYDWFLEKGLKEVFDDISPIEDYSHKLSLVFTGFKLYKDKAKYTIEECKQRDATYSAPLKAKVRLIDRSPELPEDKKGDDPETSEAVLTDGAAEGTETKAEGISDLSAEAAEKITKPRAREFAEHEIFIGDLPLMTDTGTFVINGAERVIVSQLVRSPGCYFSISMDKFGKKLYSSQVIPNRGAWLEYETDTNDVFSVKVDRNRKAPVTVLIRALGVGTIRILIPMRPVFWNSIRRSDPVNCFP